MITGMQPNDTYRAEWDAERREYQARCLELPGRFAAAFTACEAVAAMEQVVTEELALMEHAGEPPPEPLTDRRLSGRFLIRTSPTLHARLVVEANEQGVSLNHWVVSKLADRPRAFSVDDLFD